MHKSKWRAQVASSAAALNDEPYLPPEFLQNVDSPMLHRPRRPRTPPWRPAFRALHRATERGGSTFLWPTALRRLARSRTPIVLFAPKSNGEQSNRSAENVASFNV